jgi:peptide/nickel transport system substrate-binding protein
MFSRPSARRGRTAFAALALAGALGLSACGGSAQSASPASGSSATGDPVKGGDLVFAEVTPINQWQTQNARFYEKANVLNSVLDRLTYFDPEKKELVGWIAEGFEANDAQTQFTFTIRDGVTFSDGTALDGAAVKANLDALGEGIASAQIQPNVDFGAYKSSKVSGNKVIVTLSRPDANFLRSTSSVAAGLVSPATLKGDNAAQNDISKIVGSGPFVYASQVPDQEVKFTSRDDYAWAPKTAANQGAAYLDSLTIRYLPEVGNRAGAVQTGQVDLARGLQPVDEEAVSGSGNQVLAVPGLDLTANMAALRVGSGQLADVKVRQALGKAIDRQSIKDTVLSDSYTVAASILNHGAPGFVDLSSDLAYDPEGAKALLEEAGWKVGSDGIREKDGKKLEITVTSSNNSVVIKPAFELIEQQWAQVGIKLVNRAADNTFLATALTDPKVEIFGTRQFAYGGLGPVFGPETNTQTLHTDAERDALYTKEQAASTTQEHVKLVGEEQRKLVVDDAAILPLWDEVQVYGAHAGVHVDFTTGTAPIFQGAWKSES